MKLTANFMLQELVHPDIFHKVGTRCADFLHPELANTCQDIKDYIGNYLGHNESVTINSWMWNGHFESSGLRKPDDIGAQLSSHKFGCAVDMKFKTISPLEVQELILANPDKFKHISRMEDASITKTWLHCEVTSNRVGDIKVFKP